MAKSIKISRSMFVQVDDDDWEYLREFRWYAHKGSDAYYAARRTLPGEHGKVVLMHREIAMRHPEQFGNIDGMVIDHINNKTLDNRKINLRAGTISQNNANTRRFKEDGSLKQVRGVYRAGNKWAVRIRHEGKLHYLGRFDDPVEALQAYNTRATELQGEFAKLNDIKVALVELLGTTPEAA